MVHIPARVSYVPVGKGMVYRIASESRAWTFHFVVKLDDGGVHCSCEGFQARQTCKHAKGIPLGGGDS